MVSTFIHSLISEELTTREEFSKQKGTPRSKVEPFNEKPDSGHHLSRKTKGSLELCPKNSLATGSSKLNSEYMLKAKEKKLPV